MEFTFQLFHINQSHYDDVVTERSILKYCGYPLCDKELENIPKQQYKISLRNQTVYDITDRKNFCSSRCYKSSNYLKGQLLTSPLWFRDNVDVPNFQLLPGRYLLTYVSLITFYFVCCVGSKIKNKRNVPSRQ